MPNWKVEEYENAISERSIRVLDDSGRTVACSEPFYPTAITADDAATIVAAVNGENLEHVATALAPDPYDERPGVWFSQVHLHNLEALPAGTKLYVLVQP